MGFIDLISSDEYLMDVVAVKGFEPADPTFLERFQRIPVRPSVFGIVITEERPYFSNDVEHDPLSVGMPPDHPQVRTFLGVPLRVGDKVIGRVEVCNKPEGFDEDDQRLLSTFANQVAVAIDNARLYARQREMIDRWPTCSSGPPPPNATSCWSSSWTASPPAYTTRSSRASSPPGSRSAPSSISTSTRRSTSGSDRSARSRPAPPTRCEM
jgi:hypothetical protein